MSKKKIKNSKSISDGYGSNWSITCPMCKRDSMQVMRPGKVQCKYCD